MIKSDPNRLLQALIISIVFHIFVFFGMNLLDWFQEVDISPRLPPVTLRIEKFSQNIDTSIKVDTPIIDEVDKSESAEIPIPKETEQVKKELNSFDSSYVHQESPPKEVEIDAYANLVSSNNLLVPNAVPFPSETEVTKEKYVPPESIIEYESESINSSNVDPVERETESIDARVVSGETIDELSKLLDTERNSGAETEPEPAENVIDRYKYNEFPFKFSNSQVNRYLENKPTVNIPAELSSYISSEITVIVQFYLNANGILYRFDMIKDSGYSEIDSSIISELRKWVFNTDSGSEDVEGTVTIILKGK